MNYAEIKRYDIANGPGICTSIFFSGCRHHCKGCFNSIAQDFNYGKPFTQEVADEFIKNATNDNIDGLCILGGEPLQQDLGILLKFVYELKTKTNKPIWMWSGYTWEQIITDPNKLLVLKYVDVLIDGKFELEKRDLTLQYRGSSNQRIIDVKASLKNNKKVIFYFTNRK